MKIFNSIEIKWIRKSVRERNKKMREIYKLLEVGDRLSAVKLCRDHFGCGLKEALDKVNEIQAKNESRGMKWKY